MDPYSVIPRGQGFDAQLGLEILGEQDGVIRAQVPVRDALKQPAGLVHGGVFASIAESLASMGTALAVLGDGRVAMGLSNQTSFLRPITEGTVHAEARVLHRGATTWVWDVVCADDAGRPCAMTRMTIAVRETRGSSPAASSVDESTQSG